MKCAMLSKEKNSKNTLVTLSKNLLFYSKEHLIEKQILIKRTYNRILNINKGYRRDFSKLVYLAQFRS